MPCESWLNNNVVVGATRADGNVISATKERWFYVCEALDAVHAFLGQSASIGLVEGSFLDAVRSGYVRSRPLLATGRPGRIISASWYQRAALEEGQIVHYCAVGPFSENAERIAFQRMSRVRSPFIQISADDLVAWCRQRFPEVNERPIVSRTTSSALCIDIAESSAAQPRPREADQCVTAAIGDSHSSPVDPNADLDALTIRSSKLKMMKQLAELVKADAERTSPTISVDDLKPEQIGKLSSKEFEERSKRQERLNGRGKEGVTTRLMRLHGGEQDMWEGLFDEMFSQLRADKPTKGRLSGATKLKMERLADDWLEKLAA